MGLIKSRTCPPIHLCQTSRSSQAGSSGATVSLPVEAKIFIPHSANWTRAQHNPISWHHSFKPQCLPLHHFPLASGNYMSHWDKSGVGSGRGAMGAGDSKDIVMGSFVTVHYTVGRPLFCSEKRGFCQRFRLTDFLIPHCNSLSTIFYLSHQMGYKVLKCPGKESNRAASSLPVRELFILLAKPTDLC